MAAVFLTLVVLLHLFSGTVTASDPCATSSPAADGSTTLTLLHINSKCSPFAFTANPSASLLDSVLQMASNDAFRLAAIAGGRRSIPVASGLHVTNSGNYVVRVKVGTPGQLMFMVLDTSNDATWVPNTGCSGCPTMVSSFFFPNHSATFSPLGCRAPECSRLRTSYCAGRGACFFNQTYGGNSNFSAALYKDTLRLALDVIPGFAFGGVLSAVGSSLPPQGLLGLGRGPLSLLSQTWPLYQGTFSYCLPSFRSYNFSGSLRLGPVGQPTLMRTTPLLTNPHRPSLYYVNLTGVSVGRKLVASAPLLPAFDPNTGAGTVVDSGTVITRFVEPVYTAIKNEFRRRMRGPVTSLGAFDTCFTSPGVAPTVTLHFQGLDLTLAADNVMIHSSSEPLACLAMAAAPENVNSVVNVIANLQQQNHRVVIDLANSRVGFSRELCS
ncbi:Aspartic proteinase nepenthesin-1 [Nymphaea thermarum]|nr:Aspartic proteinase nepenthesin-1 [Nymphaea thermarum]